MDSNTIASFIGGFSLIIGSFLLFKGKAFYSLLSYFIADLAWLMLSINATNNGGSWFGPIAIITGIIFSLGVQYKMLKGTFHKDLRKYKEIDNDKDEHTGVFNYN